VLTTLLQKNVLPDFLIRVGIRKLLRERLSELRRDGAEARQQRFNDLLALLRESPIAVETDAANEQHYEVPAAFFERVLGRYLKYSCCYFDPGVTDLSRAEGRMLDITVGRARIEDGMDILELGCGWGSLTLFTAERFPDARITAVSNSHGQREHIQARAAERGLDNIEVITSDVNDFETDKRFDRVVSVEMFEHMRNYRLLMDKIHRFLREDGKLFTHIFVHREYAYLYEVRDASDWMAKYFFTGGIMPSDHLLLYFADRFALESHERVSGIHYQKTAEAWLANMDREKARIMPILAETYGADQQVKWWAFWRIFFMACAELWGYDGGNEWFVSHYLFAKRG